MSGRNPEDPSLEPHEEERAAIGGIQEFLVLGLEKDRPYGVADAVMLRATARSAPLSQLFLSAHRA
jgi:hypothetical protein